MGQLKIIYLEYVAHILTGEKNPSKKPQWGKIMRGKNQLKTSQVLLLTTIRMTVLHLWFLQMYSLAGYFTDMHCWVKQYNTITCRACHQVTCDPFVLKVWGHPWGIHAKLPVELNNILKIGILNSSGSSSSCQREWHSPEGPGLKHATNGAKNLQANQYQPVNSSYCA